MSYEKFFFIVLAAVLLALPVYADSLGNTAKITVAGNFLRARLDFLNMTATGMQNLSIIVTDNQDTAISGASASGTFMLPNGTSRSINFSEQAAGNYTLDYNFEEIGEYSISVAVSKEGFSSIMGSKAVYVGLIEFVSFSGDAGVYQSSTAFFDMAVRNTGNVSSQVVPYLYILDSGNNVVYSKTGFVTTIGGNSTTAFLQRNTLTWSVGAASAGSYTAKASIKFTDMRNNTAFTRNKTISFSVLSVTASSTTTTTTSSSSSGGAETVTEETKIFSSIKAGETVSVSVKNADIPLEEIRFGTTMDVSDLQVTVSAASLPPGNDAPVSASAGAVYKYIEIAFNKPGIVSGPKIKFRIARSWLEENGIEPEDAVLQRLSNAWEELPTGIAGYDSVNYYYESELPGFSLFAVTGKRKTPVPELLQFVSVPILLETAQGQESSESIVVRNPTSSRIENIKMSMEGIPNNWYDMYANVFTLGPNSDAAITVFFAIPDGATPGNYQPRIVLTNEGFIRDAIFILRVNALSQRQSENTRIINKAYVKEASGETNFVIMVLNGNTHLESVSVVENISKSIASNVNEIVFSTPPTRIISPDPIVEWVLNNLVPNEQMNITYHVRKVFNTTAPFVYSSVEQIVTVENVQNPPFMQIEIQLDETFLLIVSGIAISAAVVLYRIRNRRIKERLKEAKRFLASG